jgi:hypothetical protein
MKNLMSKWLPRQKMIINGVNFTNHLKKHLGLSSKEYRKLIVSLSKTVEQQICANKWDAIEYPKVPSQAMNKYRTAFYKHDESRFKMFIESVTKGEVAIKADTLFPYQLYQALNRGENAKAIEAQWMNLPNFMKDSSERILPMCDVSGSMDGLPMDISVSLGIYISERNTGIFKDAFVTFTSQPTMQYLTGTLSQRCYQIKGPVGYDTNFVGAFEMILDKAVKHNLSPDEMPTMILAISDMEFNSSHIRGTSVTALDAIRAKYQKAGYVAPKIVFWNVNGRQNNVPANVGDKNVALVSGASPSIMKSILSGKDFTPIGVMLETLNSKRYANILL